MVLVACGGDESSSAGGATSNVSGGDTGGAIHGVHGSVEGPDGKPIAGAFMQPKSLDDPANAIPEIAVLSGEDGRYEWSLTPGEYSITASKDGYKSRTQRTRVAVGGLAKLDFTLEREP